MEIDRKFGTRGEWWVVAQFILVPAALVLAYVVRMDTVLSPLILIVTRVLAGAAFIIAAVLLVGGILHLGRNLTPVPHPIDDGNLIQHGVYALVRHPIYAGVVSGSAAWMVLFFSIWSVLLAIAIFIFFDMKSRQEERWLVRKYPDYAMYQAQVRKLIPYIY